MVVNTFGVSIAIEKIGWKLYLIYICWQVIELVTVYLFFPEVSKKPKSILSITRKFTYALILLQTAGRSIEELSEVFDASNPVKASLKSATAAVV